MAKKLAPLVIPAVIDTSGIDKGVNSIRSKLSRVRGQGAGGGGIGGGGGGFSSGITPYGLPVLGGSGSAAAAAMAAALGAGAVNRNREVASRFKNDAWIGRMASLSGRGRGEAGAIVRNSTEWGRKLNMEARQLFNERNDVSALRAQIMREAKQGMNPRDIGRVPSLMEKEQELTGAAKRKYYLATNIGVTGMRAKMMQRKIKNFAAGVGGLDLAGAGAALYSGERLLRGISPVGIQSTLGDLTPFQNRAAGQYDIAQGMRNRAMTATTGNLTMGQQFLLGAGTEAGGGVTRTEQMGANLYEGLGAVVGYGGTLLERGLSSGVGAMEGVLQRNIGITNAITAPFNWLRRVFN